MRLYRVLVVATAAAQATPKAELARLQERLTAQGLQVEVLDDTGAGSGSARDRLSGYSGLVVLDDAPVADSLVVAALTMRRRLLDLRGVNANDQELDDWARTVLPENER